MRHWRQRQAEKAGANGEAWDPFAAVPLVANGVEVQEDLRGLLQIRKVAAPKPGVASFLARRVGLRRQLRVNLDAYGTLFWRQIDGRRCLRDIEARVREQTRQDAAESKKATILFTKMLMVRHLIYLRIPGRNDNEP